jgi:O-succinylbenzoate synthase
VKIKVAPGRDVDVVAAVRRALPDIRLTVDANAAYGLGDTEHLRRLDPYRLEMIEQPLAYDDLMEHAQLQRVVATPICLDESIRSAADAKSALDLGSCKIINVKVARVGGLLAARRIHDVCRSRSTPVWCGGMHDFGVGRAANIALASLPGFTMPGDISGSDKYFEEDIVEPPIRAVEGVIRVPDGPGLGHDVVESRVKARTVREESLAV